MTISALHGHPVAKKIVLFEAAHSQTSHDVAGEVSFLTSAFRSVDVTSSAHVDSAPGAVLRQACGSLHPDINDARPSLRTLSPRSRSAMVRTRAM